MESKSRYFLALPLERDIKAEMFGLVIVLRPLWFRDGRNTGYSWVLGNLTSLIGYDIWPLDKSAVEILISELSINLRTNCTIHMLRLNCCEEALLDTAVTTSTAQHDRRNHHSQSSEYKIPFPVEASSHHPPN